MNEEKSRNGGIGFIGLLQLTFIILKLCKVIDWSWWVVLLPLEAEVAIVVLLLLFIGICKVLTRILD